MAIDHRFSRTIIFISILFSSISFFTQLTSHEGFALGTIIHTNAAPKKIEGIIRANNNE